MEACLQLARKLKPVSVKSVPAADPNSVVQCVDQTCPSSTGENCEDTHKTAAKDVNASQTMQRDMLQENSPLVEKNGFLPDVKKNLRSYREDEFHQHKWQLLSLNSISFGPT